MLTVYGVVICSYVPFERKSDVTDPYQELYAPITHGRKLQIQNRFNTLYIYIGGMLNIKINPF